MTTSGESSRPSSCISSIAVAAMISMAAAACGGSTGHLAQWLAVVPSAAGLHVTARVKPGRRLDVGRAVGRARAADVAVSSLAEFCAGVKPAQGLVIGFGAIAYGRIDEGMRRLVSSLRGQAEG